jgi:hypothetical protein
MESQDLGPLFQVNPLVKDRPLTAQFAQVTRDESGEVVRRASTVRDGAGRVRSAFEIADIPGSGAIFLISIVDPVSRKIYGFAEHRGLLATNLVVDEHEPVGQDPWSVRGHWRHEIPAERERNKILGLSCERFAMENDSGERLEAWVAQEYGLNVQETLTGADGNARQEWRLVEVALVEPDAAVFRPPQ